MFTQQATEEFEVLRDPQFDSQAKATSNATARQKVKKLTEKTSADTVTSSAVASTGEAESPGQTVNADNDSSVTNRSTDWLLSQSKDLYTIQIARDQSADRLAMLASLLSVSADLVQLIGGEANWLLLYGVFDSRQAALQALTDLRLLTQFEELSGDAVITPEVYRYEVLQHRAR